MCGKRPVRLGCHLAHGQGREQREYDEGYDPGGDEGDRLEEAHVGLGAHQREQYRGKHCDRDIGDYRECGHAGHAAAEHPRDDRGCRGGGAEDADEGTLGQLAAEREQREIGGDAAEGLDGDEHTAEARYAELARIDFAEGDEQHHEDEIGGEEGDRVYEIVEQDAPGHRYREHPGL